MLSKTFAILRQHKLAVAAIAAFVLLAAWAAPRVVGGPQVPVHRVVQRDYVESVVASGHVEAPHRVTIGTVVAGNVLRVPVEEGQAVRAGQVLVELDGSQWAAEKAQADAAVAQAAAKLRQLSELDSPVAGHALSQALANLETARLTQQRDETLLGQGFIGPAAMDDANRALKVADAQWQTAQAQHLALLPSGTKTAIAASDLTQARAAAAAARSHLANATLVAPVAGTLIARNVEPGGVAQPGVPLMVLSPAGTVQLVIDIDEKNIHLLALGQRARASADAFADRVFDARVSYINPGVDLQRGSIEVKLDVADPPAFLRQDMTISVDVQVAARTNAVLVPVDALHDARGDHPWVLKVEGGFARRQDVRLGLRGNGFAEVLEGLRRDDLVVPTSEHVTAGARVRPIREPA